MDRATLTYLHASGSTCGITEASLEVFIGCLSTLMVADNIKIKTVAVAATNYGRTLTALDASGNYGTTDDDNGDISAATNLTALNIVQNQNIVSSLRPLSSTLRFIAATSAAGVVPPQGLQAAVDAANAVDRRVGFR